MPSLVSAYGELRSGLVKQKQGTCGLYSFWYATLLLAIVNPTTRAIPYPRSSTDTANSGGESMRHYAKHQHSSGQGEVLTCAEMEDIISHFGFTHHSHINKDGRGAFITSSLAQSRPVLFPYMMGNGGPIWSIPPNSTGGTDYGSHWSLIFHETEGNYFYIEPNNPTKLTRRDKQTVLKSNSFVDSYKYDRYWLKGNNSRVTPVQNVIVSTLFGLGVGFGYKYYDIGQKDRQNLANVLVAVS
ncbi:MAG TPA: hypothetical protein VMB73_34735 [Acetobacteraceae bacterium]|jgi:hypothetical protein|nr:hypothetical protein [Acetobacteraceae bacterium]